MPTICPKCRYERKPSDDNPSWQCPSCSIAYAKFAARDSESGTYAQASSSVRRAERTDENRRLLGSLVGGASLIFLLFGYLAVDSTILNPPEKNVLESIRGEVVRAELGTRQLGGLLRWLASSRTSGRRAVNRAESNAALYITANTPSGDKTIVVTDFKERWPALKRIRKGIAIAGVGHHESKATGGLHAWELKLGRTEIFSFDEAVEKRAYSGSEKFGFWIATLL